MCSTFEEAREEIRGILTDIINEAELLMQRTKELKNDLDGVVDGKSVDAFSEKADRLLEGIAYLDIRFEED